MVWAELEEPGQMQATMTIFDFIEPDLKESRRARVSLEARKGMCEAFECMARMHSFKANKLLLISAPSSRL
jgi:hypothetical protein